MEDPNGSGGLDPQEEPGGSGAAPPAGQDAQAQRENADLRAELRLERALRLRGDLGLTDTQFEELKAVPRDRQEDKAKGFAFENLKAKVDAGEIQPPEPPQPPPSDPANAAQIAAMASGGEVAPPAAEPKTPDAELITRLHGTKSMRELEAVVAAEQTRGRAQG